MLLASLHRRRSTLAVAGTLLAVATHSGLAQQALPSDSAVQALLRDRVESKRSSGIVVGIIDSGGRRRVASYGLSGAPGSAALDGNSVFEIGSITKVFTTAILSDMVARGEVSLDDPLAKYLPSSVRIPARGGKQITLLDLATQSSGLPRLPTNFHPKDQSNPYADYSVAQMYEFLSGYALTRDIGSLYEYSNLGMGLLGHALALRSGMSYEALVTARVLDPLGMKDTRITLTPSMTSRLAVGHDPAGAPVPNWDLPTLAGAGAIRSTVNDMMLFLAANMDSTRSPLSREMSLAHQSRRPTGNPALTIGLGWHILRSPDGGQIIWHNGQTAGYHGFLGYVPERQVGVVMLANSAADIDDMALHLLDERLPLKPAPRVHTEIALDSTLLQRFVGSYRFTPAFAIVVTRDGNRLFAQATGQPKFPIFAESPTEFFLRVVDAQLSFVVEGGAVTGVVLHQAGQTLPAKREP
ncbi:MAG: serine hydrolase [Gemmatimonadota bacterium]|nr:serine hydrolase [Gemmatimonadota bacterium]